MMHEPIKVFYAYAHEDKILREKLEKHLEHLRLSGQIATWCDREIFPGEEWEKEIQKVIDSAEIILLLISPDFINSKYCYGIEMQKAFERYQKGQAYIIPIILRPVEWKKTRIGQLEVLPNKGKPVTSWRNQDSAFVNISQEMSKVIEAFSEIKRKMYSSLGITAEHICKKGNVLSFEGFEEDAIDAFKEAIRLDPNCVEAYYGIALALESLGRYKEALLFCEKAIIIDPRNEDAYLTKMDILEHLGDYDAIDQANKKLEEVMIQNGKKIYTAEKVFTISLEDLFPIFKERKE